MTKTPYHFNEKLHRWNSDKEYPYIQSFDNVYRELDTFLQSFKPKEEQKTIFTKFYMQKAETDDKVTFEFVLAGVDYETIVLTIKNNNLLLDYIENNKSIRKEYPIPSKFLVISSKQIDAKYHNGLLTVEITKDNIEEIAVSIYKMG